MIYKPHKYQDWTTAQMVANPAFAALLPMGLGKTVATLTAINIMLTERFTISKTLIIAPLRVAHLTWSTEINKWDHLKNLRCSKILGSEKERIAGTQAVADVYIINRENIEWLVALEPWTYDCVVIDELSSFKSWQSKRFKALKKVHPERIYGLTGTPAPNNLLDLWAQIYLLDHGRSLGTGICKYRDRWFYPSKFKGHIVYEYTPCPGAKEEIYEAIKEIAISVEASEIKLPSRIDCTHYVDIPRKSYDDMCENFFTLGTLAANAAVKIGKLLQICNGFMYDEQQKVIEIHDEKLKALEELCEAANGNRIIIYYNYTADLGRIQNLFASTIHLNSPASIDKWMSDRSIQIALAHPASCGHGLNLQNSANHIIWFGLTWNLEYYLQANARICRQGQLETAYIHHILARDTVDDDVLARLQGKEITQDEVLHKLKGNYA